MSLTSENYMRGICSMEVDAGSSRKITAMIFLIPTSYLASAYPFRLTERFYDSKLTNSLYVAGPLGAILLIALLLLRVLGINAHAIVEIVYDVFWAILMVIAGNNVMISHTSSIYNVELHRVEENDLVKYTTGMGFVLAGFLLAVDATCLAIDWRRMALRSKEGKGTDDEREPDEESWTDEHIEPEEVTKS